MAWLAANWFWVLIFVAFLWMHIGGHGGHGGHGEQRPPGDSTEGRAEDETNPPPRAAGGHQH